MTITAKYPSTCPDCDQAITPGQKVEWERGSKARHASCAGTAPDRGSAPAASSERAITVERVGRRSYLRGDTLSVRGLLRDGGCHWDADRRAWWIGSHEAALALAERAKSAPAEAAPPKRRTTCVGCGLTLDRFQQMRGFKFCSRDCAIDHRMGGMSGYVDGQWHQGSND